MDGQDGQDRQDSAAPDDYFELIAVERIAEDPSQPRQVFDPEALAALKESMRSLGRTTQHVTVIPDGSGGYRLESGARRLRAARELGWTSIPAIVRPAGSAAGPHDDVFARQVADNTLRAGLRPFELCDAVARLIAQGTAIEAISASTGLSRRMVYHYVSIQEHPDLVEALRHGRPLRRVLDEVRTRREGTQSPPSRAVSERAFRRIHEQVVGIEGAWPDLTEHQRDQLRQALLPLLTGSDGERTGPPDGPINSVDDVDELPDEVPDEVPDGDPATERIAPSAGSEDSLFPDLWGSGPSESG